MNIGTKTVQAVHQTSLFSHLVKSSLDSRLDANHHILSFYFGHMEKQEMEVEWKLETENGNGNWKQKYKSGWSLSCPNRFACCCWLVVRMHLELSQPPVYLASFGVGTSNAALESSLASFPRPSPAPVLHTASDQKLEPGKAWE